MTVRAWPSNAEQPTEYDNVTLLKRAAAGDESAWRDLVDKYDALVRSVARAYRLQPSDIQDVTQTTWLRLMQSVHTIRDSQRLAGWLTTTASREALRVCRKASRQIVGVRVDDIHSTGPATDPEVNASDRDAARSLWAAVADLPVRQRNLLVTLYADGVNSYTDVAAKCSMPLGSIGPTRARALSQLQASLSARGLELADL